MREFSISQTSNYKGPKTDTFSNLLLLVTLVLYIGEFFQSGTLARLNAGSGAAANEIDASLTLLTGAGGD